MAKVNSEYPKANKQLTDAQLKKIASNQYQEETAEQEESTNKFPTEIIDLPSKGLVYPPDSPLSSGQIEMKYMTAREEDILTTQSYIKKGVVLDKLFRSLIIGNGKGKKVNYNDLIIGDKNAVMIAARVLGYGKEYTVKVTNPSGEEQEELLDLTQFSHNEINKGILTPGINNFEFTLPASKRSLTFKILTHKDSEAIDTEIKSLSKLKDGYGSHQLTTRLIHCITSVDGDDSPGTIRKLVKEELLAIDSKALRDYMKKIAPDVDLTINLTDNETGEPFTASLPITVEFFWPSV